MRPSQFIAVTGLLGIADALPHSDGSRADTAISKPRPKMTANCVYFEDTEPYIRKYKMWRYEVKIPAGQKYNDNDDYCGKGFFDNLMDVDNCNAGTGDWHAECMRGHRDECYGYPMSEGGDMTVRFTKGVNTQEQVKKAFLAATYGEVRLECKEVKEAPGRGAGMWKKPSTYGMFDDGKD